MLRNITTWRVSRESFQYFKLLIYNWYGFIHSFLNIYQYHPYSARQKFYKQVSAIYIHFKAFPVHNHPKKNSRITCGLAFFKFSAYYQYFLHRTSHIYVDGVDWDYARLTCFSVRTWIRSRRSPTCAVCIFLYIFNPCISGWKLGNSKQFSYINTFLCVCFTHFTICSECFDAAAETHMHTYI